MPIKLARKVHGKLRSKKNQEGQYKVLAPWSNILKVSPTTSTIKEPGKPIVTVRNSDTAEFGTMQERQTLLKVYADRRGPRTSAMRGRIPKIPDFLALRNQYTENQTDLTRELVHPAKLASPSALQQVDPAPPQGKGTSDCNRRSPSYYGLDNNSSSDSAITAPPKRPRRAGDIENFQPPSASLIETVEHIAVQRPDECNFSADIGEVSPPAQQVQPLIHQDTPTLVRTITVLEAESQELPEQF